MMSTLPENFSPFEKLLVELAQAGVDPKKESWREKDQIDVEALKRIEKEK